MCLHAMSLLVFLGLLGTALSSSPRPGRDWATTAVSESRYAPGLSIYGLWGYYGTRDGPLLRPIAVQCGETDMVVNVQRDLFGTGKLIQAADLRIGTASCKYTSLNADNTVTFQVALQACGNTVQVTFDFLTYSSVLTYNPTPSVISRVIVRTNPASVPIRCIYPRHGNVSSNAIKPTWVPFSSTLYAEGSLDFSLRLMTDDWASERGSSTFYLGDVFHIEASVQTGNHAPVRIFVDSCVATLARDSTSNPRYDLITANGCFIDGKLSDSSSTFLSPRAQLDTLRFMIDAFRFSGDSRSLIYITCHLKAVTPSKDPDSTNKACSYSKSLSGWVPVEGPSNICNCCDSGSCLARRKKRRNRRNVPLLASTVHTAMIGPLRFLQQPDIRLQSGMEHRNEHDAATEEHWMVLGLVLVVSAVFILFVTLGALVLYNRCRAPDSSNGVCK